MGSSLANGRAGQRQSRSWAGLVGLRSSAKTAAWSYAWREEGGGWCVTGLALRASQIWVELAEWGPACTALQRGKI